MSGAISDQTTVLSNISLTGNLAVNPTLLTSGTSSSRGTFGTVTVQGGVIASGVTLDLRTNSVKPSSATYGVDPSGFTIGQWGFNQNASGFSIFISSGKSIYFFGGSTLSAAQS